MDKKRVIASEVSKAGGHPDALAPKRDVESAPVATPQAPQRAVVAPTHISSGSLTPMTSSGLPGRAKVPVLGAAALQADDNPQASLGLGAMMQAATARVQGPEVNEQATVEQKVAAPGAQVVEGSLVTGEAPEPVASEVASADQPNVTSGERVPMAVQELMQSSVSGAASPGPLQKMRDQGFYRSHHFKEAQCFECDNKFKVGRSSRSANCPACSAYISLEDVELNMPSTQSIKTRGDVLIRKRGHVSASHLFARDLRCFGLISANTNCSGDAIFKTSGTIIGEIWCRKFIVEKGSDIEFMNEVHADEIEINASVKGHFFSKGKLSILASGAVDGSVTGRSINIEPGGELNGGMNIVRGPS